MDGSHSKEGRLEIFYSGIWGSVCNDDFGQPDATVACRQLGFRYGIDSKYIFTNMNTKLTQKTNKQNTLVYL